MATLGISVQVSGGTWLDLRTRISREDLSNEWLTSQLKGDGFFDWGSDPLEIPVVRVCRDHETLNFSRYQLVDISLGGVRIARGFVDSIRDEFAPLCRLSILPVHLLLKDVLAGNPQSVPGSNGEEPQTEHVLDTRTLYGNESGYVSVASLATWALQSYTANRAAGMPSVQFMPAIAPEALLPWGGEWISGDSREVDAGGVRNIPGEDLAMGWRWAADGVATLVVVRAEIQTDLGRYVYHGDQYRQSGGELVLHSTVALSTTDSYTDPGTVALLEALATIGEEAEDNGPLSTVPTLIGWRLTSELKEVVRDAGGTAIPGTIHQQLMPDGWLFVTWLESNGTWFETRYVALNRLEALKAVFRDTKISEVLKALAAVTNRIPLWSITGFGQIQLTLLPRTDTASTAVDLQVLEEETTRRQVEVKPQIPVNEPDLSGSGFALSKAAVKAVENFYADTYTGEVLDRDSVVLDPLGLVQLGARVAINGTEYGRVFSLGEHALDGRRKLKATTEVQA